MRLAKWIYGLSALYGVIVLTPLLFLRRQIEARTAAFTHPEYFYGFLGAALSFQLVFALVARDPVRLRPIMPATVVEKLAWGAVAWTFWLQGRTQAQLVAFASVDLVLGVLFFLAWTRTPKA